MHMNKNLQKAYHLKGEYKQNTGRADARNIGNHISKFTVNYIETQYHVCSYVLNHKSLDSNDS